MLGVGDRDMENGTVSVRRRSGEDLGAMSLEDFAALRSDGREYGSVLELTPEMEKQTAMLRPRNM